MLLTNDKLYSHKKCSWLLWMWCYFKLPLQTIEHVWFLIYMWICDVDTVLIDFGSLVV